MAKDKWDSFKEKGADVAQSLKEKGSEVFDNVQKNPAVQDAVEAARKYPKEAILVSLMVLGLIFSFYWLGSLVVGLAAALYIPWDIKEVYHKALAFYRLEGKFPTFILLLALIFLLIHTFWFVVGLAVGFSVKLLFKKHETSTSETEPKKIETKK
jgi:hypothetical protein